jgi:hypothetical protein
MHEIALQRLYNQRLVGTAFDTPEAVVSWLGAVQSQEYQPAKWSLGLRIQNPVNDLIEQAFTAGTILRTHVMRPTWHFVTPADIRWMLELTAPRVNALSAYYYRQLELDDVLFSQSNAIFVKALQNHQYLTRAELRSKLAEAGIMAEGVRLSYIVMRAELDAVICSGPRRGKQFTYALLAERAPQALVLGRDEALAELTSRYFTGHGPATLRDFAWWSGLTVADAKRGLEMVASHLTRVAIDEQTYWLSASMPPAAEPSHIAFLLPTFDEFVVGYDAFDQNRLSGHAPDKKADYFSYSTLVVSDRIAGSWKRILNRGTAVIDVAPFSPLSDTDREAIKAAAQRYGEFLNMPVQLL